MEHTSGAPDPGGAGIRAQGRVRGLRPPLCLPGLLQAARTCVPDPVLHSDLAKLSRFAGGTAYGNPDLDIGPEQMLINVRNDVARLFDICAREAGFNSWTCRKTDYQRGA